jgi:hypothetical protein
MPPTISMLPRIVRAQVAWLSQPGRSSAVALSRTPGWAPAFMMTRL